MLKVYGVPECLARFAALEIAGLAGAEAGRAATQEEVIGIAQQLVPVLTGETQASIQKNEEGVEAGGAGLYLEFGTSRMAAQPFMRPAADTASGEPAERAMLAAVAPFA